MDTTVRPICPTEITFNSGEEMKSFIDYLTSNKKTSSRSMDRVRKLMQDHKPAKKRSAKPIPKTQIGLSKNQKDIMKRFIGKAPHFPVDLNKVREWEKYGDN